MRVFVTGSTGFIGFPVVQDLISHGHQVLGLARSDESAKKLQSVGAQVHRGLLKTSRVYEEARLLRTVSFT
jgi:uncharacterized protein YbjT (DUF2867 family)